MEYASSPSASHPVIGKGGYLSTPPSCDALVEGGQRAEFHPPARGGLSDEQGGRWRSIVEFVIGQHAHGFQLFPGEQLGFDEDWGRGRVRRIRSRDVGGLSDQGGAGESGVARPRR
ncbi:hypothetical protein G1H10_13595 [Phytoactinopolyspora halotolerans]|uniref:Uncharacterized protein n=1 Tax=Phytoactinopolyspora halotolerans TaxID=1981512 RepID=A0A6L9S9G4_9ACTN|nr:hypothetical protein [Phytoactinopolyspora halotolerans]NEE01202.1 hypothetical protein [Phytoactinopolyspora halotolerans]